MKYLKLFPTNTDYQSFITGDTFVTPNVSFAIEENLVFYNPYEEKINYVACFRNPFTNTSNFEVTVEDMDIHATGNYIKVPETGLNITIKNISEKTYNVGLTNEFNDGPFYELASNTEVIIQLYINSYGDVCVKGPDGRTGGFASSEIITLPDDTSLLEYSIYFEASEV